MTALAAPLPIRLARLVRIEHTVFALPFAYVGALLAIDGWPGLGTMGWITLAMVGARTLAMSLNRLIDSDLDASNPRTAGRELPAGVLTRAQVLSLCGVALAVYLLAVLQLEPIVRWLWPIPVVLFVVYPYLKRVTWLCHLWLGAVDGLAPVGGWVAVTGVLAWQSWILGAAERPGLPRKLARDRDPRTDGREAEARPEPEVAEPREALEVRIGHEHDDRDRP